MTVTPNGHYNYAYVIPPLPTDDNDDDNDDNKDDGGGDDDDAFQFANAIPHDN